MIKKAAYLCIFGSVAVMLYIAVTLAGILKWRDQQNGATNFMVENGRPDAAAFAPLNEISPELICSVIKAEDRQFFRHSGFDWQQIAKAFGRIFTGQARLGSSSISQQLTRNIFLHSSAGWFRKFRESLLTVPVEFILGKQKILELYLNHIEWGDDVWGIAEASRRFFAKPPGELNIYEALFLGSLVAAPRAAAEGKNLERMRTVYHRVAHQFRISGLIVDQQYNEAALRWEKYEKALGQRDTGAPRVFSESVMMSAQQALLRFTGVPVVNELLRSECGLDQELSSSQ